jgi:hypothetical protein
MLGDKRKTQRQTMFSVCRYNIEGREYADLSTNISERGMFLKNTTPPKAGAPVMLKVQLPGSWGNQEIKIIGRVAWVNNGPDPHKRGLGIEFISIYSDSDPMVRYFVREAFGQPGLKHARLDPGPGR